MTNEIAADLAPLLAKARILMFEYDADGFLTQAVGSCLGGSDPELEVRAGLVSPDVVRRTVAGETVVVQARVGDRTIEVRHEPIRSERGRIERVVATAFDVTGPAPAVMPELTLWRASLPAAS